MGIYIRFPLWDNKLLTQKTTYVRRFWVQSAYNLPKINGFRPSCKFVVLVDGQIVGSSAVVKNCNSPIWLKMSVELNVVYIFVYMYGNFLIPILINKNIYMGAIHTRRYT